MIYNISRVVTLDIDIDLGNEYVIEPATANCKVFRPSIHNQTPYFHEKPLFFSFNIM